MTRNTTPRRALLSASTRAAFAAALAILALLAAPAGASREKMDRAKLFLGMMVQNPGRFARSAMTVDLAREWTDENVAAFQAETTEGKGALVSQSAQKVESLPTGYVAVYTAAKFEKGWFESAVYYEDARDGAPVAKFELGPLAHFTEAEATAPPPAETPAATEAPTQLPDLIPVAPVDGEAASEPVDAMESAEETPAMEAADEAMSEAVATDGGMGMESTEGEETSSEEMVSEEASEEAMEASAAEEPEMAEEPEAPAASRRMGPVSISWGAAPYETAGAWNESASQVGGVSATIVAPRNPAASPAPAVLFVSIGGDADDANGLFENLARGLASRGAYAMRLPMGQEGNGKWDDGVDSAVKALAALRSQSGVNPAQVYLAGHGLGATLAPEIARRDGKVAGLAMLSAQSAANVALLEGEASSAEARDLVGQLRDGFLSSTDFFERLPASDAGMRKLDFASVALDLGLPMIFLHGSLDEGVTWEDRATWQTPLGAQDNVAFYSYGRLNHWLVEEDEAGAPASFAGRQAFDDLAFWLSEATGLQSISVSDEAPPVEDDFSDAGVFEIGAGAASESAGDGSATLDFGDAEDNLDGVGVFELK